MEQLIVSDLVVCEASYLVLSSVILAAGHQTSMARSSSPSSSPSLSEHITLKLHLCVIRVPTNKLDLIHFKLAVPHTGTAIEPQIAKY